MHVAEPEFAVPSSATQHRAVIGQFSQTAAPGVRRGRVRGPSWSGAGPPGNVDARVALVVVLLLVTNAAAPPPRVVRASGPGSFASPPVHPCPPSAVWTVPTALHHAADFARAPISSTFDAGRDAYYQYIAHRCAPPESVLERSVLQVGDVLAGVVETALLGPVAAASIHEGADVLDLAGDALEGKPLDMRRVEDAVFAQGGIRPAAEPVIAPPEPVVPAHAMRPQSSIRIFDRTAHAIGQGPALPREWMIDAPADTTGLLRYRNPLTGQAGQALQVDGRFHAAQYTGEHDLVVAGHALEHRDGMYWLRDGEGQPASDDVVAEDEEAARRCRREPGGACAPAAVAYSSELDSLLRAHHDQGLTQQQADQRGIIPDPQRPGWHVRIHHGQRKAFLQFQGRYFRVRASRIGGCQRLTVHAARVSHAAGVRLRHPLGGQRLGDIAESPAGTGPRFMTQAEYNVRFRGFSSLNAANVYEQAVRNAPHVQLSQGEQAAIVHYASAERPLLDVFLRRGPAPPSQRDVLARQAHELQQGLARIPPYVGPVYRGVTLPASALEGLEPGQTVFCRSFVRASGDRTVAMRQLAAGGNEVGQVPVLVTLHMTRAAHPVGLYTLQDEAGVLIDSGRVFTVAARHDGELVLEEAGVVRQAFGQRGARAIDLS